MKKYLISLIVPCYNVEKVCDRFFQSLLEQTYSHIQIILVNDGSTDGTEEKLFSYKQALEQKGCFFDYIYQENKGLGGAINTGLKKVRGEFLCWADPDDYYEKNAFEVRVDYFLKHDECNVLTCDGYQRRAESLDQKQLIGKAFKHRFEKNQFELLLDGKSVFCAGVHMVKVSAMKKVNPDMDIYEAKRGQNWQLLLPMYFSYERHYLDIPVYNYIVYPNSMSSGDASKELKLKRYCEHEIILNETLKRIEKIQNCDMHRYYSFVKDKYFKLKLITALRYKDKLLFQATYKEKQKQVGIDRQDKLFYLRNKYHAVDFVYKLYMKLIKHGGGMI